MKPLLVSVLFLAITATAGNIPAQTQRPAFQPTFESLERVNPVPEWFKDAKFGIYFHWGVYAVPAFGNEWYPRNMYHKDSPENKHHAEVYGDPAQWPYNNFLEGAKDKQGNLVQFAPKLKSEGGSFDPGEWARLFADAGAKFVGPVAEHHDGISLWASKVNPWNAKDMGPHLDLVGLLVDAIRRQNMKVLLSMHHAYNITGYYEYVPKTDDPQLQKLFGQQGKEKNEAYWLAKHKEIIDNYRPDIIYQDFNLHVLSQPVLLGFLSYYYNRAAEWNKEVVATFKDGLNKRCAVLDYERGGPPDITDNYWLTDDAVSSSSWCYTEGIRYYSTQQILHALIDRVSKNGNMVLNISPKADGTIPQEQKEILSGMGAWLRKYGEAIYGTRAWEQYGEGPTKMGAAYGVMSAPKAGTARDVRFTRSKDSTTLYAILLGWDKDEKEIALTTLSSNRIDLRSLKSIELMNGGAATTVALASKQDAAGLHVTLPERSFEELAYVLRLTFRGSIPAFDRYADLNCAVPYLLLPGEDRSKKILGTDLSLTSKRQDPANQWTLEAAGKGLYRILNRARKNMALEYGAAEHGMLLSPVNGKDNQVWKIENARGGLWRIFNKQYPHAMLAANTPVEAGRAAVEGGPPPGWTLLEVCEKKQEAFKPHVIPGTVEAEDFDTGCPGEAYYDRDEVNEGGEYRVNEGVDIEKCSAGGYNVGWTHAGEFTAYTVTVAKSATYRVTFLVASSYDTGKLHLESDDVDKTGILAVPNTGGFQAWTTMTKTIALEAGRHVLRLAIDGDFFNIDKMVFEEAPQER